MSSVSLLPLSPLCLQLKLITGSMDHPVHPIENYVVPCTSPPETWESGPKTVKEYLSRIRSTLNGRILHCVAHIVVRDRIVVAVHRNGRPQPPSSTSVAIIARETFLRYHHQLAMDMDLTCFGYNFLGDQHQSVMNMDANILENLPQMGGSGHPDGVYDAVPGATVD